jgi:hypothetical protein
LEVILTNGYRIKSTNRSGREDKRIIGSASSRPTNLGRNLPKKINMIVVIIRISASSMLNEEIRKTVNKEANAIFTKILEIRSAEKKRLGFLIK